MRQQHAYIHHVPLSPLFHYPETLRALRKNNSSTALNLIPQLVAVDTGGSDRQPPGGPAGRGTVGGRAGGGRGGGRRSDNGGRRRRKANPLKGIPDALIACIKDEW